MYLFRYIIIFLLVWWIIRTVTKMFVRFSPNGRQQTGGSQSFKSSRRQGDIHIDYVPGDKKKSKTSRFKGGEYVDYEEVD